MKKYLLLLAILLPFILISCGDDKDEPKNLEQQLIGGWSYTEGVDASLVIHNLIFNANHTGKMVNTQGGVVTYETSFTWSLDGDVLTMNGPTTEVCTIAFEGNQLHLKFSGVTFYYNRAQG